MTRQLATMISSGMTLLRAFYVLEEQIENKLLRETVGDVREDIEAGLSFSEALAKHPKIFSPLYVAMVRAGEAGGVLEESLERVSDQLEKDDSLRRQVKSAMAYPTVVMTFAFCVLVGLIAFIVPVFVGVFKDFGGELPTITKFTVELSDDGHGPVVHPASRSWSAASSASRSGASPTGAARSGTACACASPSRSARPSRRSRSPAGRAPSPPCTRPACRSCRRSRSPARPPATPWSRTRWRRSSSPSSPAARSPRRSRTPRSSRAMVAQMIAVGEETGNLDTMLSKVADFYEDEVAAAIKALTSILEPVMIVLVGGIVGFIVIAMYMPMFKVYDAIK